MKESLGSSNELLSLCTDAVSRRIGKEGPKSRRFLSLRSLPPRGQKPIEIRIPLGSPACEVQEQMPRSVAAKELPRGRRRAGWREEMSRALGESAKQIGDVSTREILVAVKADRRRRRGLPEVTAVARWRRWLLSEFVRSREHVQQLAGVDDLD